MTRSETPKRASRRLRLAAVAIAALISSGIAAPSPASATTWSGPFYVNCGAYQYPKVTVVIASDWVTVAWGISKDHVYDAVPGQWRQLNPGTHVILPQFRSYYWGKWQDNRSGYISSWTWSCVSYARIAPEMQ